MLKRAWNFALNGTLAVLLGACGGPGGEPVFDVSLSVVSSAPDQVSGGDARIVLTVEAPDALQKLAFAGNNKRLLDKLKLRLNGNRVSLDEFVRQDNRLEGVVHGLVLGENLLTVEHPLRRRELARLLLINHPIEGPIFSGPHQQPFVCSVQAQLGIQPKVDSAMPPGFPVKNTEGDIIGYSRDCSVDAFTTYMYLNTDGAYKPLPEGGERPADMSTTMLDGRELDFVVRWERGTINRFIYSISMLAQAGEPAGSLDTALWNKKLVYRFQGGVGIGYAQGGMSVGSRALQPDLLAKGYAIAYSTGNKTGEHYNLQLGGETALMVKERFIEQYGAPLYTVGLGASGGAIQQYVYGQNHPGLIDAGVPIQSYPDMVTQIIHVGDCELLEYFMDATDRENSKWHTTTNRSWLVGLNATDDVPDPFAGAKTMLGYGTAPGSTECIPAWRGLTPLAMNPHYGAADHQEQMVPPEQMLDVDWSHYADLRNIYGEDEAGWPRTLFDNVGVQYGLASLNAGLITAEEFLKLNAQVGGWKQPKEMVQEGFPFLGSEADVLADPSKFDPWSSRNMLLSGDSEVPAARTLGNLDAIAAAYNSGMVFHGELDIPLIDWRPYLEHKLDMHNSHQSFAARQRMLDFDGDAGNQLVWFMDARPEEDEEALWANVHMALDLLDEWMANIRDNPEMSVAENRPAAAMDKCFTTEGALIAEGESVWDGIINNKPAGLCTQYFETHSTSRIVAGAPIQGDYFKCALKSVDTALADGTYGSWEPDANQIAQLEEIFLDGVCDYSQPDQGNPFSD